MKPKSLLFVITATAAAFALNGCKPSGNTSTGAVPEAPAKATRAAPAEGRAIVVIGNDSMKFDVTRITAKPGEALAVTLKNQGTMPKFSMGHNWVLIESGVNVNSFASDASTAVKTEYVPASYADRIIAHCKLLGPGESDTVLFYAPTKPGRYTYLCTFPGHCQVGMKGELIVE